MTISRRQMVSGALATPFMSLLPGIARAAEQSFFAAPIVLDRNRVWTGVSVEGLPPAPFIIDTGMVESAMSAEWAEEMKLRERGASYIGGVGGLERSGVLKVEEVVIGGVFRIPYMEFHGMKALDDRNFKGLIGVGLMTEMASDLDFVKGQWRIYPGGRPDHAGLHAIPDSYLIRGFSHFLSMPVQIDGFAGRFALDTGAPRNLLVDGKASTALGWWDSDRPYAPQRSRGFGKGGLMTRTYRAGKVKLHKFAFPSALVTLAEPGRINGNFDRIDGLVGIEMLRHFHLTTDPKGKQLWAAPNGLNFAGTERYPLSGLWFERKGDRIEVVDVGTGSPAAGAGVRIGDTVVDIAWERLLKMVNDEAGTEVAFDFDRGGARSRASFTLKPFL